MLEEEVQVRMTARVDCNLKQRHENILQHLLKVTQLFFCVVDVTLRGKHKKSVVRSFSKCKSYFSPLGLLTRVEALAQASAHYWSRPDV